MPLTHWGRLLPPVALLMLPFGLFYWIVPAFSNLTIGNDYGLYAIHEQLELQFALKHGDFPLFVPGFACGRTSAALTLGQLFHPLPYIASLFPSYFNGHALEINTMLRLLSLGIAHLALFALLIRLRVSLVFSFLISFVTVYNLRMLDVFRYGASLENYTGMLFLGAAIAFYFIRPSCIKGPVAIIASFYLTVSGGHPQMMYMGLAGAFIVGLAVPSIIPSICPDTVKSRREIRRYYKLVGLCALGGLILSAAYLIPFVAEFLLDNSVRVDRGYGFSLSNSDNLSGMISNFFYPQRSDVHGAFGGSSLILCTALIPILLFLKIQIPRAAWALYAACALIFLAATGDLTPIHYWFWKILPFFDSFRTPGRVTMVLMLPVFFLLAFLFTRPKIPISFRGRIFNVQPFAIVAMGSLLLSAAYFSLIGLLLAPSRWVPGHIVERPFWIDPVTIGSGTFFLIGTVLLGMGTGRSTRLLASLGIFLIALAVIQTGGVLRFGTWQKQRVPSPSYAQYLAAKQSNIKTPVLSGFGMESTVITKQISRSILEPKLAKIYRKVRTVNEEKAALAFAATSRRGDQAVVIAPKRALSTCASRHQDRIRLIHSSYNQLTFKTDAACEGLFTLSFPYSASWQSSVDGSERPVYEANGYELGVFVPKGRHVIELRYQSLPRIIGLCLSGFFATVIGVSFLRQHFLKQRRVVFLGFTLVFIGIGILIAAIPIRRMYNGNPFKSHYVWTSKELPSNNNLAYAKKTRMEVMESNENPYYQYSGLAVDGDRNSRRFVTNKNRKGWWQVDLGSVQKLRWMDLFGGDDHTPFPLTISVSIDKKKFTIITSFSPLEGQKQPRRISLNVEARYVRMKSQEKGSLSFSEIEIY
jgi:hypothetical protein